MNERAGPTLRFLPLARLAREEIRAATYSGGGDDPLRYGALIRHALWAALVAEYVRAKARAPSNEDAAALYTVADYLLDDAIAAAEQLMGQIVHGRASVIDALVVHGRSMNAMRDCAVEDEIERAQVAIDTMIARATRFAEGRDRE